MKRVPANSNTGLVMVEEKPLSKTECSRLGKLEDAIQQNFLGFVIVGMALAEINEKRLYRNKEGRTFEQYCCELWDMSSRRAYQLIGSAIAVENVNNCSQTDIPGTDFIAPQNEAQARELAKLEPEEQVKVWSKVIQTAEIERGKITASKVKKAVNVFRGVKLKTALKQTTTTPTPNKKKKTNISPAFEEAWKALWDQVEIERQSNWRYTSKSVVYERTSIILEAIAESGIKNQPEREAA